MKNRALVFMAALVVVAFLACSRSETTVTETATATTTTSTTTETISTTTTETVMPTDTTATVPATTTDGKEQIREGAKQLGQGLKEEARKAVAATGAALERGGEAMKERAEQAAPQPSAAPPAAAPPTTAVAAGNAAAGKSIFSGKCTACHGADASSNTAMGKKNAIPDLRSAAVQGKSDAQLASVIANGKAGGLSATAHKSKALTPAQIQDVIAYLRSIRQ